MGEQAPQQTALPIVTIPAFGFDVVDAGDDTKVIVVFVPGLVQLQLPLGASACRDLVGKLSGGIVIPENFNVGDITGLAPE